MAAELSTSESSSASGSESQGSSESSEDEQSNLVPVTTAPKRKSKHKKRKRKHKHKHKGCVKKAFGVVKKGWKSMMSCMGTYFGQLKHPLKFVEWLYTLWWVAVGVMALLEQTGSHVFNTDVWLIMICVPMIFILFVWCPLYNSINTQRKLRKRGISTRSTEYALAYLVFAFVSSVWMFIQALTTHRNITGDKATVWNDARYNGQTFLHATKGGDYIVFLTRWSSWMSEMGIVMIINIVLYTLSYCRHLSPIRVIKNTMKEFTEIIP